LNHKLIGLETFDKYHLIALVFTLFIVILVPLIGSQVNKVRQEKFIFYLVCIAITQELIDYISRFNFDGLNLAEDLPFHICSYALIMSCYGIYKKNQFCFEFSYLMGVTGTFFAILTPEFNDFDGWIMYVTYFIHHGLIITFSMWNIFIDKMKPRKLAILYCLIFLAIMAIPVGITCWFTGGNYMFLARIPNADNPLLFGEWPFYIINCTIIGVLLMLIAKFPFDVIAFMDKGVVKKLGIIK